jgi:hypothetical protein
MFLRTTLAAILMATLAPAALAPVALAQAPLPASCGTQEAGFAPELSSWTKRDTITAAKSDAGLAAASLKIGQSYTATMQPTGDVSFITQPERPGGSVSKAGLFELNIAEAGTYAVALGTGAWIDLLGEGAPLVSVAHGRGPECTTIRKMVDFSLQPGRYVIQISATPSPDMYIMVARRP